MPDQKIFYVVLRVHIFLSLILLAGCNSTCNQQIDTTQSVCHRDIVEILRTQPDALDSWSPIETNSQWYTPFTINLQQIEVISADLAYSLLRIKSVQNINLIQSGITDEVFKLLASHPTLEKFQLDHTGLTVDSIKILLNNPNVTDVIFRESSLSHADKDYLVSKRPDINWYWD